MPMDAVIIGFALSAGAVAFLNPCGFAMLPTYVSYFVESNTQNIITASSNSRLILVKRLARAGSVGLLVTAAFIITFGLTGIAISSLGIGIAKFLPWIALSSGIVIIGIGVAKAFGKTMRLNIPSPRGFFYSVHGSRSSNDGKEIGYPSFFFISEWDILLLHSAVPFHFSCLLFSKVCQQEA
jgi:cytochrome c biogenesis protein CcdA